MRTVTRSAHAAIALAALLLSSGCMSKAFEWKPVPKTEVRRNATSTEKGLEIVAEDHSFSLKAGERKDTPFQAENCPIEPTAENWPDALSWGAKRVRVHHPAYSGELYGILTFCKIPKPVTGAASTSNYIRVPTHYVTETEGGRRTVVWEPVKFEWHTRDGDVKRWPTWALWLSRSPFVE